MEFLSRDSGFYNPNVELLLNNARKQEKSINL